MTNENSISREDVRNILNQIELIHFKREKIGRGASTFYFYIIYNEKKYVFIHTFYYHGFGVDHIFKFKKPFFQKKPFELDTDGFVELSAQLMKIVNTKEEWSTIKS